MTAFPPWQVRLLIAGSRAATPPMLEAAQRAVERAVQHHWLVMVGDNPQEVDATVVGACIALAANYVVFGISATPRNPDVPPDHYHCVSTARDYTERDRFMVQHADRGLFVWNGTSPGTLAGYDMMKFLGKPADLLNLSAQDTPPIKTLPVIELVLDVAPTDNNPMQGIYGLRALDASGKLLRQKVETLPLAEANTTDYARLMALETVLGWLVDRAQHKPIRFNLRVIQSSKNIDGWLAHGWRRKVDRVLVEDLEAKSGQTCMAVASLLSWLFSISGNTLVDCTQEEIWESGLEGPDWTPDEIAFVNAMTQEALDMIAQSEQGQKILETDEAFRAALKRNIRVVCKALNKPRKRKNPHDSNRAIRKRLRWPERP